MMRTIYAILGYPLGWIMFLCYHLVNNYGLALILFTILTKLVLVPFAVKQQKSMVKMAAFRPKMEEIQRKYANNKEKLNEELLKLYEKENYNPMSGCLPVLIQFPILFGLIDVIYYPLKHILRLPADTINAATEIAKQVLGEGGMNMHSVEMSIINAVHQNAGAFSSLGADVVNKISNFDFTFFGMDLGVVPTMAVNVYLLIPILAGLSALGMSLISMKLSSATTGEDGAAASMNKSMLLMMPLMSVFISFQVPAGVGVYWLLSNVFAAAQSYILNKIYDPVVMVQKAKEEAAARKEQERKEKIEAKKRMKQGDTAAAEKALTQKEINRMKLAAARKRDAEKYGEEYVEVTDDDLK